MLHKKKDLQYETIVWVRFPPAYPHPGPAPPTRRLRGAGRGRWLPLRAAPGWHRTPRGSPPAGRRRKVEFPRSVRELSAEDVIASSRRARYTAGRLSTGGGADGRQVPPLRR